MENQVEKSAEKIKEQIEFWFVDYFGKSYTEFDGKETFTLFDKLDSDSKTEINETLNFEKNEFPVLILRVSSYEFIISSTQKFIQVNSDNIETIDYSEFECHIGFKSFFDNNEKSETVKEDGHYSLFGLRKKDKEIIYWKIPTGIPGFGFWNVTNKCGLIGRKYKVVE